MIKRWELTTAFDSAVTIDADLSLGKSKKIAVVGHFLEYEIFIKIK